MDRQFLLDMAAAHAKSTTAQNKAHAAAYIALADRAYPATPPVVTPPAPAPTPTPAPTPAGGVPTRAQVGPRTALGTSGAVNLAPGNYQNAKLGTVTLVTTGVYTFTDCELAFATVYPGRIVTLDHCKVAGGIFFEDANGFGGHAGWTINWSLLDGGANGYQALRPKGPGVLTINDSIVQSHGAPDPSTTTRHTEAFQAMYGAKIIATRVGFSMEPKWVGGQTSVTAVMTFESPNDGVGSVLTDCEFGWLNGSAWVKGGGYYAVYPAKASFVRPRVHTGTAGSSAGAWYSTPISLTDPVYLA